jgi:hypothetical protein
LEPPSKGAGATHACKNLFKHGDKEGETDAEGVIDPDAPLHNVEGVAHVVTWAGGGAALASGAVAGIRSVLGAMRAPRANRKRRAP